MKKKVFWFAILSILMVVALSGCFNYNLEIHHNPDGTGRYRFEQIWIEELLFMDDEVTTWDEVREDLMEWSGPEDLSTDDPNIRSVSTEDFINPDTNAWHYIMDVAVNDMLIALPQEDGPDQMRIQANPDGTYRFSYTAGSEDEEYDAEFMEEMFGEERGLLEKTRFTMKLFVNDFIEADPMAVYNPAEKVVIWEVPMDELFFNPQPYEFWAVYRIDAPEVVEVVPEVEVAEPDRPVVPLPPPAVVQPEQDAGFLGLPNWVPFVLAGLCCLSLVAVVVVILVVVVLKKRKNPAPPPRSY